MQGRGLKIEKKQILLRKMTKGGHFESMVLWDVGAKNSDLGGTHAGSKVVQGHMHIIFLGSIPYALAIGEVSTFADLTKNTKK